MIETDRISETVAGNCADCSVGLLEILGCATDESMFEVTHRTTITLDDLFALHDECRNSLLKFGFQSPAAVRDKNHMFTAYKNNL